MFLVGLAELAGFIVLLPACLCKAWTTPNFLSIKPLAYEQRYYIDKWRWNWLNAWYANTEDGVSGQQAWIYDDKGHLIPYASTYPSWTPKWVIAYGWSAWRNGANNIKRPLRG